MYLHVRHSTEMKQQQKSTIIPPSHAKTKKKLQQSITPLKF